MCEQAMSWMFHRATLDADRSTLLMSWWWKLNQGSWPKGLCFLAQRLQDSYRSLHIVSTCMLLGKGSIYCIIRARTRRPWTQKSTALGCHRSFTWAYSLPHTWWHSIVSPHPSLPPSLSTSPTAHTPIYTSPSSPPTRRQLSFIHHVYQKLNYLQRTTHV